MARPTSSSVATSIIRCTIPAGAGKGASASEWCRGLHPRNRIHSGGPAGRPNSSGAIRIESRSRKPSTSALARTVVRFNEFAQAGRDEDFHRGDSAHDRYYSDPRRRPNPCLAPLATPPFYAIKIVPGDLGTKGGLRTDERARVLRGDGTPIAGLYAAGNTSAAVMGHSYAGAGATIGPAMTFGYLAALDLAAGG
jgi:FAD binding domain